MAVHVPLSIEAQLESRLLMLASNSIFSPASGRAVMTPTQDIALGIYYLTIPSQQDKLHGRIAGRNPFDTRESLPLFGSTDEVLLAHAQGHARIHARIRFRNPDYGRDTRLGRKDLKLLETTVGRVIFNEIWPADLGFVNEKVDKSKLGDLILTCHQVAGHAVTVQVLDKLKTLGFEHATLAGVSMGIKDMIRPASKDALIERAREEVRKVEQQLQMGVITEGERHNKIVDIWTTTHEKIADDLFVAIDKNISPEVPEPTETNPMYMMVDSKARGSKAQLRQLGGMRGLMAKPSGEIIENPITASFREGLSVLEYFISSHGARKGLADTALKTADAGYLTRKLVDVAQDVNIVMLDCNTVNGIEIETSTEGEGNLPLRQRILGRTSLHDIIHPVTNEVLLAADEEIDEAACDRIEEAQIDSVWIRSGLTCDARHGMCAKCYGRDLSTGRLVEIGTAVGIIAAQSIGEPGTQLTMRTFHIGGTAQAVVATPEIVTHHAGVISYEDDLRVIRNDDGQNIVLNKNGALVIRDANGRELERVTLQIGTALQIDDGAEVTPGTIIAIWDPHSVPVLAEKAGIVSFHDFVEDVSVQTDRDAQTGLQTLVVMESRETLHPQIIISDPATDSVLGYYHIPVGAHVMVHEGERVTPGRLLAKTPRKEGKTRDITGGLPRVAELFEARHPKDAADIAKIDGVVEFGENQRGRRCLIIRDESTMAYEEHLIPMGKHIVVFKGDRVRKGQQLTDGPIVPQEILDVCGPQELQSYLVSEVQQVYRLQGVEINDKHIEIIVRQMLRKVRITNPGDTDFLWGEQVTRQQFLEVNQKISEEGKRPAAAQPALLGITKASLETDSFISAASFQDTTRVLTDAATMGRVDELRGFKENVILGHLIPGGTGFPLYRHIKLVPLAEPIDVEELNAAAEAAQKKAQDVLGF
jgi:DNA-directed RNA polymerase subunit beta'